jgi:hypothetical protein
MTKPNTPTATESVMLPTAETARRGTSAVLAEAALKRATAAIRAAQAKVEFLCTLAKTDVALIAKELRTAGYRIRLNRDKTEIVWSKR